MQPDGVTMMQIKYFERHNFDKEFKKADSVESFGGTNGLLSRTSVQLNTVLVMLI